MNILLSIVIPVYNVADYLPQCLDSVLIQNLENCEVICVNDGSTDNSRAILEKYRNDHPKIIIIDRENGGLSAARNTGLKIAKGEYVYFLDSDDYLYPDVLQQLLHEMMDSNLDLLCANVLKDGQIPYYETSFESSEPLIGSTFCKKLYNCSGFYYPAPVWMYMYKRQFLNVNGLAFKEGFLHEDEDFTPKALYHAQRVKLLNIFIQFHRIMREGAITSVVKPKHIHDTIEIARSLFSYFKEKKELADSVFLHSIFFLYANAIKKTVQNNLSQGMREIFTKQDVEILRTTAQTDFEHKFAKLAKYNLKIAFLFYSNQLPTLKRKIINRIF